MHPTPLAVALASLSLYTSTKTQMLLIHTHQYTEESFYLSDSARFEQSFEGTRPTKTADQQRPSQMTVQARLAVQVVRCSRSG